MKKTSSQTGLDCGGHTTKTCKWYQQWKWSGWEFPVSSIGSQDLPCIQHIMKSPLMTLIFHVTIPGFTSQLCFWPSFCPMCSQEATGDGSRFLLFLGIGETQIGFLPPSFCLTQAWLLSAFGEWTSGGNCLFHFVLKINKYFVYKKKRQRVGGHHRAAEVKPGKGFHALQHKRVSLGRGPVVRDGKLQHPEGALLHLWLLRRTVSYTLEKSFFKIPSTADLDLTYIYHGHTTQGLYIFIHRQGHLGTWPRELQNNLQGDTGLEPEVKGINWGMGGLAGKGWGDSFFFPTHSLLGWPYPCQEWDEEGLFCLFSW